jgi:predicted nucleic acid-binding protein
LTLSSSLVITLTMEQKLKYGLLVTDSLVASTALGPNAATIASDDSDLERVEGIPISRGSSPPPLC